MVESKTDFTDHAGLKQDSEILAGLDKQRNGNCPTPSTPVIERIVFTGKVIKYNRFGMKQERTILLTNLYLSNIKKKRK